MDSEEEHGCCQLENWEVWKERRDRTSARLGALLDRPVSRLLMNREDPWLEKRTKLHNKEEWSRGIRDYRKTFMDVIASRHLSKSMSNFQQLRKKMNLYYDDDINHESDLTQLVILGTQIRPPEEVPEPIELPAIHVEKIFEDCKLLEPNNAVLEVGPCRLVEGKFRPFSCRVDMCPVRVPLTMARDVRIANTGPKAVSYSWIREPARAHDLPLKYNKNVLPKFFFNKSDGILLPGQSFEHRFLFRSSTPGIFREKWSMITSPRLPTICFELEAMASSPLEREKNKTCIEIEKYLEKCMNKSSGRELVDSLLQNAVVPETKDYSGNFLEKEIFMEINPTLQYDMDALREIKQLHSRFTSDKWNYSMADLCEFLLDKTQDLLESERSEVMDTYCRMLGRMRKKPLNDELNEDDWDRFKMDLCYMVLCSAIAQMETSLRLKNWGIPNPPRPPGKRDEYNGEMFETEVTPVEESQWTDEEEERLLVRGFEVQENEVEETYTLNTGQKIDLTGREGPPLPDRRWPRSKNEDGVVNQETFQKKTGKDYRAPRYSNQGQKGVIRTVQLGPKETPSKLPPKDEGPMVPLPSLDVITFHRAFQVLQWRNILGKAVESIVAIVDQINVYKDSKFE